MSKTLRALARGGVCLAFALTALWAVAAAAPAQTFAEAARSLGGEAPLFLLRFERGDLFPDYALSLPAALTLCQTPLLLESRDEIEAAWPREAETGPAKAAAEPPEQADAPDAPDAQDETAPASIPQPSTPPARDNGVPSSTLRPSDPAGYLLCGSVYVSNGSAAALSEADLGFDYSARPSDDAPQVLIVHTHGCEAYTMPPGEEYVESDDHRTLDDAYNVVRVGDEVARVLTEAGLGVLHDRTLHDYPSYSGAYGRSLATVEKYLEQYPSIVYVLDLHRDAVTDADGKQYKLLCAEEPDAAQLEFVIGSDGGGLPHPRWRENLKLACAVQATLLRDHPTLMRPIVVRNSRYNQQATTGSLLVEVGTAGNSLDEALAAARLFAAGFAETVKTEGNQPVG